MAEVREVIERVITEADARGLGEATRALVDMARAEDELRAAADGVTSATERQDRIAESITRRYQRMNERIDQTYKAQQAYERDVVTLTTAQKAFGLSADAVATKLVQLQEYHFGVSRAAQESARALDAAAAAATRAAQVRMSAGWSAMGAIGRDASANIAANERMIAGMGSGAIGAAEQAALSVGMARHEMIQFQQQFMQFGQQVMAGSNPLTALSMQAADLGPKFGQNGLRGAVSYLAAGITSMITPVNLWIFGLAGAAAVIPTIWAAWDGGADRMKQDIEEQNRLLDEMKSRYGKIVDEMQRAFATPEDVLRARSERSLDRVQRDLGSQSRDYDKVLSGEVGRYYGGAGVSDAASLIVATKKAMDDGTFSAREYQKALIDLGKTNPGNEALQEWIDKQLQVTDAMVGTERQLGAMRAALAATAPEIQRLMSGTQEFNRLLQDGQYNEAARKAVTFGQAMLAASAAQKAATDEANRSAAVILSGRTAAYETLNERLQLTDHLSAATSRQAEADRVALAAIRARTVAEEMAVAVAQRRLQIAGQGLSAGQEQAALDQAAAEVIARSTRQAQDTLLRSQNSAALADLYGYNRALAEINQRFDEQIHLAQGNTEAIQLLSQARDLDVRSLQRQQILAPLAERGRSLVTDSAMLRVQRDTFGLPTAQAAEAVERQRIINELFRQGVTDISPYKQWIDELAQSYGAFAAVQEEVADKQAKVIETLDSVRDFGRDSLGGLLKDLSRGKNPMDTLINAGYRLGDRLIDQGVNSIIEGQLGKQGTAQGPLGSLLISLFGAKDSKIPDFAKSVAAMTVQAGSVIVNGAAFSGLGGLPGLSGKTMSSAEALSPIDSMQLGLGMGAPSAAAGGGVQRAFLDAIARVESGGRYDVRFNGSAGGATFDPMLGHPNVAAGIPWRPGLTSTAAGRYQFLYSTAVEQGYQPGTPFTPAVQDQLAWQLAQQRSAGLTGGDLAGYLQTHGFDQSLASRLGPTWEGLQGGGASAAMQAYQSSLTQLSAPMERLIPPLQQMPPVLNDMQKAAASAGGGLGQLGSVLDSMAGTGGAGGGLFSSAFSLFTSLFGGGTGSPAGSIGGLYADGGWISGPGGPRDDSILMRASNGEFVVNAAQAARHRHMLEAINSGALDRAVRRADGGWIGSSPAQAAAMASMAYGGGGGGGSYSSSVSVSSGDVHLHVSGNADATTREQILADVRGELDARDQRWAEITAKREANAWRRGAAGG